MIKTGLWRTEQLSSDRATKGFFGGTRRVSITLYDQVRALADGAKWAERILFGHSDGRGIYKRTYSRRFDRFDDFALSHVATACAHGRALRVHDAGVSDARTACEFFRKFDAALPVASYCASDHEATLSVLEHANLRVTTNQRGEILEIVRPPFVFNLTKPENFRLYPLNYACFIWARRDARRVLDAHRAGAIQPRPMQLFCPEALELAASDRRFRLIEHDLLAPFPGAPVDIVRAMNVLNASYFTDAQLRTVTGRIFESLVSQGLLILGSNDEAGTAVRGGIYRKSDRGFSVVALSGARHDAHDAIVGYQRVDAKLADAGQRSSGGPGRIRTCGELALPA